MKQLIEKLGKENKNCMRTIPPVINPIYYGDIIQYKLDTTGLSKQEYLGLFDAWEGLGFHRSLQQIAECGYEEVAECECKAIYHLPPSPAYEPCWELHRHMVVQRLKDPNARALEDFLTSIL